MLVAQLCLTLCNPHGLQPTRLLSPWDFSGKDTVVVCHFLLQGIFLTQRSNPHLRLIRQILYHCATWEAQIIYTFILILLKSLQGSYYFLHLMDMGTEPQTDSVIYVIV